VFWNMAGPSLSKEPSGGAGSTPGEAGESADPLRDRAPAQQQAASPEGLERLRRDCQQPGSP